MMLNAQGLETNPDILKELVYLPGKEGSLQVEMVAGARSHDMLVYRLPPEPEAFSPRLKLAIRSWLCRIFV